MKKFILVSMIVFTFATIGLAQDPGWPRLKSNSSGRLVYYQPQVDEWKNHKELTFRMALSLTPTGKKAAIGVAQVHALTNVNVDDRTVLISNFVITGTNFPGLDAGAAANMEQLVRTFLPLGSVVTISLDRLVASVNKSGTAPTVELRNDPPTIFISHRPSILLQMDGPPVLADIPKTNLKFVVNTNWPVFLDKSKSNYYLFTGKRWLTTTNPQAQWSATARIPKDMSKLAKDPQWTGLAQAAIPAPAAGGAVPTVFYTTGPAEVILFEGQPVYSPIGGTNLVRANNTESDLFVYNPTQQFYYLAAGRWFRSASLQGPWTYATPELPRDFANIPAGNPAARVLVSVPGTEAAKDAVLLAQVPTTVTVDPATAATQVNVSYNGPPEFRPIEGTSLSYATNTPDKVVKVGDVYYLCTQGIWFMSSNAQGPWQTAKSIPKEIYSIPPSSPVYNVTYVTQTTTSDGYCESSYTAGYMGSFIVGVGLGVWIAGGTGYYYPPYFYYPAIGYPIYRPWAATYGVGAYYNSYTGAYGVARGVYGPYAGATGWASYNPYTGTYARGASAYGPYGSASVGRAYNPYTGTYARGGTVSTAYRTRTAAGAYNPYTGVGAATRQGSSPYGQWGTSVVARGNQAVQTGHVTNSQGTIAGARSTSGAKAIGASGDRGSGGAIKTAGGDMYAGGNGNVYKKTNGSWQKYDNGSWNSVNRPTSSTSPANRPANSSFTRPQVSNSEVQSLNRDFQNRQRGAAQSRQSQTMQRSGGFGGSGRGGFGGGGRGGFGGRRR